MVVQARGDLTGGAVIRAGAQLEDMAGRRAQATTETRVEAGVPLHVSMELNPDPVQPGELMDGLLTVTNSGRTPMLGVQVELLLPDPIAEFGINRTGGASAACVGDTFSTCSARERLVWTVGALAPGAGVTLSMPPAVGSNVAPGSVFTFNARAREDGGLVAEARGSLRVESARLLDLALDEDRDPVEVGERLTYRLSFGNKTTTTLAQGVVLQMALPPGVVFVEASDGGVFDAQSGVVEWPLGTLTTGANGSREVVVETVGDLAPGTVLRAEAMIEDMAGQRTRAATHTRVETAAPLRLAMELNPDPARPGETVIGRLTVTNVGEVERQGVEVEVLIPKLIDDFGSSRISGASSACVGDGITSTCSTQERLVWTVGALAPGAGMILSMPPAIGASAASGRVLTFNARARADDGFSAEARGSVRVDSQGILSLAVDGDVERLEAGETLTYRLTFGNRSGTTLALGAVLQMPLPAEVVFMGASDGAVFDEQAGVVSWNLGTLGTGQGGSREVVVQTRDDLINGAVIRAEAQLADMAGSRTRATTRTRVGMDVPLHLGAELNPDPVQPGELMDGLLTVTNTGPTQMLGVQVEVFLPDPIADFAAIRATGASATCVGDGISTCSARERLVWTVGALAPRSGVTLSMPPGVGASIAPGRVFTFNARARENTGFTADARGSLRVESVRLLDLALDEDRDPVEAGERLTYRLGFGNKTSTTPAQGVVLQMGLPAGVAFLGASDGGVFDEQTGVVEWMLGMLAVGESGSREVVVETAGDLADGAVIRAAAQIEDVAGRRTRAATETRVETAVPLRLTMELNPDPVRPGETVNGRLTITNVGSFERLGVEVEVLIPKLIADFGVNRTSGATATCLGDGSTSTCSVRERLVWTVSALGAGVGVTLAMPPAVDAGSESGRVLTFNARARENSGSTAEARGSVRVDSQRILDLAVDDDVDPVEPGEMLTYRLTFGNRASTTPAQGVVLQMPLPVGVVFLEASDDGVFDEQRGVVSWDLGTLGAGQGGSREVVVQARDDLFNGAVIRAEAQVDDDARRRTRATTETRVEMGVPLQLGIDLTPDIVVPGGLINGTLVVMNAGSIPLLGVQVEVAIPDTIANFPVSQTSGASATCIGDGSTSTCSARERLVWTGGTLAPGAALVLGMPPRIGASIAPGVVSTFNARARENTGFTAEARGSVRVRP